MKNLVYKSFLFFTLVIFGCIEDIPYEGTGYTRAIVVSGKISTAPGPYTIKVNYTAPYSTTQLSIPEPITGATVEVIENGSTTYSFIEIDPGVYKSDVSFVGKVNSEYKLVVTTSENEKIESSVEKIIKPPKIENISVAPVNEQSYDAAGKLVVTKKAYFYIDTTVPADNRNMNLRWSVATHYEFQEVGDSSPPFDKSCFIPDVAGTSTVAIARGRDLKDGVLKKQVIFTRTVDDHFYARYGIQVYQQAISDVAYNFFQRVYEETVRSGSIFEKPPTRVIGNMKSITKPETDVLGLFYAHSADTASLVIHSPDVGGAPRQCNVITGQQDNKKFCNECLTISPLSSITKPSYWP